MRQSQKDKILYDFTHEIPGVVKLIEKANRMCLQEVREGGERSCLIGIICITRW